MIATETQLEHDDLEAGEEAAPRKPSGQILRHELQEAMDALDRSPRRLFFSGFSAGLEIGFSLFLMATVIYLGRGQWSEAATRILVANMYSFGFILVVLGRSELFTEQTSLAVMPVLSGQASIASVARLWILVFLGNQLGAALFAMLATIVGPRVDAFDLDALGTISRNVVDHAPLDMLFSGMLAGWLMGLLSWLVAAGRDTISQIVIVWLIATAIGLGRLHHAVLGSAEVLGGMFAGTGASLREFGVFLFFTTLGNAVGGPLFVALLKSTHSKPEPQGAV